MKIKCNICGKKLGQWEISACEKNKVEYMCYFCLDRKYNICDSCGMIVSEKELNYVDFSEMWLCNDCYKKSVIKCNICGMSAIKSHGKYIKNNIMISSNEEGSIFLCNDCYNEVSDIKLWYYEPHKWQFYKMEYEQNPLYFGIELEYDSKYERANKFKVASTLSEIFKDKVFFKIDKSLSAKGIELVSHPSSIDYHIEEMKWEKAFNVLKSAKYFELGGFHITVAISDLDHKVRIVQFFEKYWDYIIILSGREKYEIKKWCDKYYTLDYNEIKEIINEYKKYKAVNIKHNGLVEFRIFKATLFKDRFNMILEFIYNIIKYTQEEKDILSKNLDDFIDWCNKKGKSKYINYY